MNAQYMRLTQIGFSSPIEIQKKVKKHIGLIDSLKLSLDVIRNMRHPVELLKIPTNINQ